jgi:rare lipoprotein A
MRKLNTTLVVLIGFIAWTASAAQEFGIASVYSSKFQGSRTASGEIFNHNQLTAAHKRLPFGSLVKITRTDNGKSVIVRINDRGPFVSERVTDLSKAAGSKLGIGSDDEVRVKIEEYTDAKVQESKSNSSIGLNGNAPLSKQVPKPIPMPDPVDYIASKGIEERSVLREYRSVPTKNVATQSVTIKKNSAITNFKGVEKNRAGFVALNMNKPNSSAGYAIQVAVLSNHENMVKKVDKLDDNFNNVFVSIIKGKTGNPNYKVMIGPFESQASAANYLKIVKRKSIDGFVVNLKSSK